jgi:hypothetical protein
LGVRPYHVYLIQTRWSGGDYGEGTESLVSETELTPPPRVEIGVTLDFKPFGQDHSGSVVISRISLRYTEHDLLPDDLPEGTQFYYELRQVDGKARVRAFPNLKPVKNHPKKGIGWALQLMVQDMPRTDEGRIYR